MEDHDPTTLRRERPEPGLVLVWSEDEAKHVPLALEGGRIELTREKLLAVGLDDRRISRVHALVEHDGTGWSIEDLESRNGTWLDGERIRRRVGSAQPRVLRLGRSLFAFSSDIRRPAIPLLDPSLGVVAGRPLAVCYERIIQAARYGDCVAVTGESGTGKELAARVFHAFGPRSGGPFVAINCAAIPHALAESLLFGTKKGAYSGSTTDTDGYLVAAHGGTLFLDEIAELDAAIQAKLLRALETREVLPVGASRYRSVDIRLCSATHESLRGAVGRGKFRKDLYFRIGRPEIEVPPLRDRVEDIPLLLERARLQSGAQARIHISFVEACLLRHWSGNVRELLAESKRAFREAALEDGDMIGATALDDESGTRIEGGERRDTQPPLSRSTEAKPTEDQIRAALERAGSVAGAAKLLNIHRTQLRRWIASAGIDAAPYRREVGAV
ncbi:MAG: sigma 54-interacting transcriptional regulator [Polyangiaceae bacterium]|nr:sigma 54-interacting transcriptional regulator [Polyangiaceae bacterium]